MRTAVALLLLAPCIAEASDPFAPGVAMQQPGEGVAGLREVVRNLKAGMDFDAVMRMLPAATLEARSVSNDGGHVSVSFRAGKTYSLELEFRQTKIVAPAQSGLIRAALRKGDRIIAQVGG